MSGLDLMKTMKIFEIFSPKSNIIKWRGNNGFSARNYFSLKKIYIVGNKRHSDEEMCQATKLFHHDSNISRFKHPFRSKKRITQFKASNLFQNFFNL